MLLFIQASQQHWLLVLLGALGTVLATILASPLLVRIYERRKRQEEQSKFDSKEIELTKDQELYKIRQELREEVEALRQTRDVILTEKLDLNHKLFLLDNRLKEQDGYVTILETDLAKAKAQIELLERRIQELEAERTEWLWNKES